MKIVCPSCEATYQVPEAVHESRRQVRCARCGNSWVPGDQPRIADEAEAAAEPVENRPITAETAAAPPAAAAAAPFTENPPATPFTESAPAAAGLVAEPEPAWHEPAIQSPIAPPPVPMRQSSASALGDIAVDASPPAVRAETGAPLAAWITSVLVMVGIVVVIVVLRAPIMKAWPASERLFAAIGLYHAE